MMNRSRLSFLFLILWLGSPLPWALRKLVSFELPTVYAQGVTKTIYPVNLALLPPTPAPQTSCQPANPAGTHAITLCWTASASTTVVGYNVYASTTSGGPYTKFNATPVAGTTTFFPTGSLGGVKEFFVFRAFDGTAESINSSEVSATGIGNPPPPTAPQAVAN